MKTAVSRGQGGRAVRALIRAIHKNKQYLSEIDGAIGDGDHGINMNKGFTLAGEKLADESFTAAFETLGLTLLEDIGGSMGPLYGSMFLGISGIDDANGVDKEVFGKMLEACRAGVEEISPARPGDKTLMDTLVPAVEGYKRALEGGADFKACLEEMKRAAAEGRDSTLDMVAKLGRASRLGERSRGVLDAGAASCCVLLTALADELIFILTE